MAYTTVFKRYELKYLLTPEQRERLLPVISTHMQEDAYGSTTVRNVYYDTESYRLIRHSLEKPIFKEKLRLRSYATVTPADTVFVELKRKYDGVVYKRRHPRAEAEATAWMEAGEHPHAMGQIAGEINYFLSYYRPLAPRVFLSYEREAYFAKEGDLRLTLDSRILARTDALSLTAPPYGTPLIPDGMSLLELKCAGGIPLWMVRFLSEEGIRRISFSKYGTAYRHIIYPTLFSKEALCHEKSFSGTF